MDGIQLRDEAAQDRVRAAIEFLDPSKFVPTDALTAIDLTWWLFSVIGDERARRFVGLDLNECRIAKPNRMKQLSS
jgi:hypothetical protein